MPTWPTLSFPFGYIIKENLTGHMEQENTHWRTGNNIVVNERHPEGLKGADMYYKNDLIDHHKFQKLYECEEERMVYKACLREIITMKKSWKHTSWDTADISSLYLN